MNNKKLNKIALLVMLLPFGLLQGCAVDALSPQPDDPAFSPVLPEEEITLAVPSGSLYNPYSTNNGLYSDTKAHKVGDLILINLDERTVSSKGASTSLGKERGAIELATPTIAGRQLGIGGYTLSASLPEFSSEFAGTADSQQNNSLVGNISVSVVKVLANGNLVVRGEKWLMLNNGNEYIRVTGIIRSEDVDSDNTISSQKVANARIQYGGTGDFANTQERGWLSKFLNSAFNIFS